jgi:uncharacterized membrane protein
MRRYSGLWKALILPACVAYSLLVHSVLLDPRASALRFAIAFVPFVLFACWVARRSEHKRVWACLLGASTVAVYFIEREEGFGAAAANALTHAGVNLLLLWFFGRTLVRAEEPLVTRFARRMHGPLPAYMENYTRRVTLAWCLFFIAQIIVSGILLFSAPLETWSFFVNVLTLPLLAVFFTAEYVYRVTRYRDYPHSSILKGMQAFAEHTRTERRRSARVMNSKTSGNACG